MFWTILKIKKCYKCRINSGAMNILKAIDNECTLYLNAMFESQVVLSSVLVVSENTTPPPAFFPLPFVDLICLCNILALAVVISHFF